MSEAIELKPCPFCGGDLTLTSDGWKNRITGTECENCEIEFMVKNCESDDEWIERISARATPEGSRGETPGADMQAKYCEWLKRADYHHSPDLEDAYSGGWSDRAAPEDRPETPTKEPKDPHDGTRPIPPHQMFPDAE